MNYRDIPGNKAYYRTLDSMPAGLREAMGLPISDAERNAERAREAEILARHIEWHRKNAPRLAAEAKAAREAREAAAQRRQEKKEALKAWRAGVKKILDDARRREATRPGADAAYIRSCEHLNNSSMDGSV